LIELPCGITISDVENITIENLPQLEVLTSRPQQLSQEDLSAATEILSNFQQQNDEEVSVNAAYLQTCL